MRNLLLIFIAVILATAVSCKKKNNNTTPPPVTPLPTAPSVFISFTIDGAAKTFTGTEVSIHTGFGGGSFTSSGFFNFTDDVSFNLNMPLDSIMGADLQALVGTKIPIGSCGGCPTNIELQYAINGDDYRCSDSNNALPNDYVKFNSVTFHKTVTSFGKNLNQYMVTGEFNLKLSYGSNIKSVTSGTFSLPFRESKH